MKIVQKTIVGFIVLVGAVQFAEGQLPAELSDQPNAQQRRDALRIAIQEICPVSGQKLGSMGTPLKVKVGEETVFLCCKGCMKQQIKPQHWATIHANFARAQRICPVMKHDLPAKPKWTIVDGQIIYVCCPPCTEKIAADPQKYLRTVDEQYVAALEAKKQTR